MSQDFGDHLKNVPVKGLDVKTTMSFSPSAFSSFFIVSILYSIVVCCDPLFLGCDFNTRFVVTDARKDAIKLVTPIICFLKLYLQYFAWTVFARVIIVIVILSCWWPQSFTTECHIREMDRWLLQMQEAFIVTICISASVYLRLPVLKLCFKHKACHAIRLHPCDEHFDSAKVSVYVHQRFIAGDTCAKVSLFSFAKLGIRRIKYTPT